MADTKLHCPFCGRLSIAAVYRPAYRGFGRSRGSGVSSTFQTHHGEQYFLLGGCAECGKNLKEVKQALNYR